MESHDCRKRNQTFRCCFQGFGAMGRDSKRFRKRGRPLFGGDMEGPDYFAGCQASGGVIGAAIPPNEILISVILATVWGPM